MSYCSQENEVNYIDTKYLLLNSEKSNDYQIIIIKILYLSDNLKYLKNSKSSW